MPVVPCLVILQGIISFILVSVLVIPASFIAVVVVTSSIGISIAALGSVTVVSPELLLFRVLTVAWFYVLN